MNVLSLLVALLSSSAPVGQESAIWNGADIAAFRAIQEEGLASDALVEAYASFIESWPTSPLAEVALERSLHMGANVEGVLARLEPAERAWLVGHYRAHHAHLAANPVDMGTVSDAGGTEAPQDLDRSPRTHRAMRISSR